jgi:hypothetical protein
VVPVVNRSLTFDIAMFEPITGREATTLEAVPPHE